MDHNPQPYNDQTFEDLLSVAGVDNINQIRQHQQQQNQLRQHQQQQQQQQHYQQHQQNQHVQHQHQLQQSHHQTQHHQPPLQQQQLWNSTYQMNQFPTAMEALTTPPTNVGNQFIYGLDQQQLQHHHQQQQQQQAFYAPAEPHFYPAVSTPTFAAYPPNTPSQNFQSSKKRLRRNRNGQPATRRRTLTACESCRLKKIKCDLTKPVCGSCTKNHASCLYRTTNQPDSEVVSNPGNTIKDLAGLHRLANPPKWSSCNWYSTFESVLSWPILEDKYKVRSLTSVLCESGPNNIPSFGIFTPDALEQLSSYFQGNLSRSVENFITNVQNKNPFMNFKVILKSVEFFAKHSSKSIYDITIPENLLPLPILLMIVANALMAKPLTFKNHLEFKSSFDEKAQGLDTAHRFYSLAMYLQSIPKYHIPDFDLYIVILQLLKGTYWMYNMKPLKAWDCIYKSSTLVMTILESLKSSDKSFSEDDHNMLARVFHTSLKYESEFRVEFSPFVPSSGITNYEFQELYPSPPLDGSMLELKEELSWFYYLTEIILRKLENRILDKYYIPESRASGEVSQKEKRGFKKDQHVLRWELLKLDETIDEITEFLEELAMIEENIQRHIKSIFEEDEDLTEGILQPHGFHLKPVNFENLQEDSVPFNEKGILTPQSDTSSAISQKLEALTNTNTRLPEVLNFIQTRMISLKLLLFRPVCYIVLHHDLPGNANYSKQIDIWTHPFISPFLKQCNETMDLLNLPLSSHRHFGSWFYLRNVLIGGFLSFSIYKKFKVKFCSKEKIEDLLKNTVTIFEYWRAECNDLEEGLKCIKQALNEVAEL